MKKKCALITGISGQDGPTMADYLLEKGYYIYGLIRRNANKNLGNAKHLADHPNIDIIEGDITDMSSMLRIIQRTRPHEIYNFAAMSHVGTSFEQPIATTDIDYKSILHILESVKGLGYSTRIWHAATSEMFGSSPPPQNEGTRLNPQSPYAIAKVASYQLVKLYRKAYNMYCCSGITFNHEEPGKRGPMFVTRKISMAVANIVAGKQKKLSLGNLSAKRDWGMASDYMRAFHLMLQQPEPKDYVIATGEMHSVEDFVREAFACVNIDNWEDYVSFDRFLLRPAEVEELQGDASKIKEELGWEPKVKFDELVKKMVKYDLELVGVDTNQFEKIKEDKDASD